jgi:hypothetical protein
MAKAAEKTSTEWIWLSEALALALRVYGSRSLAEERLKQARLLWDCEDWQGEEAAAPEWKMVEEREGTARVSDFRLVHPAPAIYKGDPRAWTELDVDFDNNEMHRGGVRARGVKMSRAGVLALLFGDEAASDFGAPKAWLAIKASELKAAGKIPEGIKKAEFSRLLAAHLEEASKTVSTLRALSPRYIANHLSAWGLWPISSIR